MKDGSICLISRCKVQTENGQAHTAYAAAGTVQSGDRMEQAGNQGMSGQNTDKCIKQAGSQEPACFYA